MTTVSVTEQIDWVGTNDYETKLFEALWPLPNGVSYNAYLIRDTKNALIDTVKKNYFDELLQKIQSRLAKNEKIDYLIINHIEPDHSGALEFLTRSYPEMCIVGNEKTIRLLNDFYRVPNKTLVVKDRDTLSLGSHTLEFILAPMVHWPETMLTYEHKTQTLFSGDVFGGFGGLKGGIFDDEVDLDFYVEETRRYFSNIIGKYCSMVERALAKVDSLAIKTVCSAHGPIYRKNPKRIIDLYSQWSRYITEKGVVIAYASMYDHTKKMAEIVAQSLSENGVRNIKLFNLSETHFSFVISDIWRFQGVIVGCPTYNSKLFPWMELLLSILQNDQIQKHLLGLFGSYSWGGGAMASLKDFAKQGNWKVIEPFVEAKCAPSEEVLEQCRILGKNFALALLGSIDI